MGQINNVTSIAQVIANIHKGNIWLAENSDAQHITVRTYMYIPKHGHLQDWVYFFNGPTYAHYLQSTTTVPGKQFLHLPVFIFEKNNSAILVKKIKPCR